MISAFGVEHGEISKAWSKNARVGTKKIVDNIFDPRNDVGTAAQQTKRFHGINYAQSRSHSRKIGRTQARIVARGYDDVALKWAPEGKKTGRRTKQALRGMEMANPKKPPLRLDKS